MSEHWETLFDCEGDWALAQFVQRCGRDSICEDLVKPSECGPGQVASGGPA